MLQRVSRRSSEDRDQARHVLAALLARRGLLQECDRKAAFGGKPAQIGLAVRMAPVLAERETVAVVGLHAESEETVAGEHPARGPEGWRERGHVDEHVDGDEEIGGSLAAPGEEADEVALVQAVVEMRFPGFRQHPRREVDALDDRGAALERPRGEAGAAAEIEPAAEAERTTPQGAGAAQRRGDQLRASVGQVPDQMLVEARRVVVEERPDIA